MKKEKRITTRQLLREFKKHKEMLINGEVDQLNIGVGNGEELIISRKSKGNSEAILKSLMNIKRPRKKLKRPEGLFEGFFKNLDA